MRGYLILPLMLHGLFTWGQEDLSNSRQLLSRRVFTRWEIIGGVSSIRPRFDPEFIDDDLTFKVGLSGGLALEHGFSSSFSLGLNVLYETKGYKFEITSLNEDYNPPAEERAILDGTYNYVTASIAPRYLFGKGKNFYVGLGPYIGYLIDVDFDNKLYRNGVLVSRNRYKGNSPDAYKWYDLGLTATVGYRVDISARLEASVQFLYNRGLTNIVDLDYQAPMSNTTYGLMVGISLKKIPKK